MGVSCRFFILLTVKIQFPLGGGNLFQGNGPEGRGRDRPMGLSGRGGKRRLGGGRSRGRSGGRRESRTGVGGTGGYFPIRRGGRMGRRKSSLRLRRGGSVDFLPGVLLKSVGYGFHNGIYHVCGTAESHFLLGGVHIDVHQSGLHLHIQKKRRMQSGGEASIAVPNGPVNELVLHGARVHKDVLPFSGASGFGKRKQESRDGNTGADGRFYRNQGRRCGSIRQCGNADAQIRCGGKVKNKLVVPFIGKPYLGISQGMQAYLVLHMGSFRFCGFEELAARWSIVKQVGHLNGYFPAFQILLLPGTEFEAGNAGNAGQSLSAESQVCDFKKLLQGRKFAGGVPFGAQLGVCP